MKPLVSPILSRLLDPVSRVLTPDVARKLANESRVDRLHFVIPILAPALSALFAACSHNEVPPAPAAIAPATSPLFEPTLDDVLDGVVRSTVRPSRPKRRVGWSSHIS